MTMDYLFFFCWVFKYLAFRIHCTKVSRLSRWIELPELVQRLLVSEQLVQPNDDLFFLLAVVAALHVGPQIVHPPKPAALSTP